MEPIQETVADMHYDNDHKPRDAASKPDRAPAVKVQKGAAVLKM